MRRVAVTRLVECRTAGGHSGGWRGQQAGLRKARTLPAECHRRGCRGVSPLRTRAEEEKRTKTQIMSGQKSVLREEHAKSIPSLRLPKRWGVGKRRMDREAQETSLNEGFCRGDACSAEKKSFGTSGSSNSTSATGNPGHQKKEAEGTQPEEATKTSGKERKKTPWVTVQKWPRREEGETLPHLGSQAEEPRTPMQAIAKKKQKRGITCLRYGTAP